MQRVGAASVERELERLAVDREPALGDPVGMAADDGPEVRVVRLVVGQRREAQHDALGRAVAVKCVATNIELVEPVAALAATGNGDDLVAQARRIFEDDLVDVTEVD